MTINIPVAKTHSFAHGNSALQRQIRVTYSATLKNVTIASFIYASGLIVLGLLSVSNSLDDKFVLIGMHLIAALSFYSYWKREPWGSARYDCFGAAVLLLSIGFRILSAFDALFYGTRFDQWPTTIMVDGSLLSLCYKGEAITFFGVLLMVATWRLTVRDKLERFTFLKQNFRSHNLDFKILYSISLFIQVLSSLINIYQSSLSQLFSVIYMAGVASIYFIAQSNVNVKPSVWIIKAVILGLPFSIAALSSGMKEYIFLPFVPSVIIAWLIFSSVFARFSIVIMGVIMLSLSQIYVSYIRQASWFGDRSYSFTELVSGGISYIDKDSLPIGIDTILLRTNFTLPHAMTIAMSERDGFIPEEIFGSLLFGFIPRILWPDKPIIRPGAQQTQRIRGSNQDLKDVDSSSAGGLFAEVYLGGSVIVLIIFSVLYGFLVGRLQLGILNKLPVSATAVLNYMMYYAAIRLDERTIGYSLIGIMIYYIALVFIFKVLVPMFNKRLYFK